MQPAAEAAGHGPTRSAPLAARRRNFRSPVVLTARGTGVLVIGIAFLVAAWAVDTRNLFVIGVAVMAYAAIWFVVMAVLPAGTRLRRQVTPERVRAGDPVRVVYALEVSNATLFPVPEVVEAIRRSGREPERLTLSGSIANRRVAVDLPALPRGVHLLGPTAVSRTDPTALFSHRYTYPGTDAVIVWPRTVPVAPVMAAAGLDGSSAPQLAVGGFDFRGLREFVAGDDPRRIHWASSAKRGDFLVKETDPDRIETLSLVLDCRAQAYGDTGAFEVAICAAASAIEGLVAIGWQVRLVFAVAGGTVLDVDAPGLLGQAMDRLAYAALTPATTAVLDVVESVRRAPGGPLVLCGGLCDDDWAAALSGPLRRRTPQLAVFADERRRSAETGANPLLRGLLRPGRSIALPFGFDDLAASWVAAAAAGHGGAVAARRAAGSGRHR